MIEQNVTILSNDMNTFDDIKSLIFNILRSVEIDKNGENMVIANKFWMYLAKCFYESYRNNGDGKELEMKWNNDIIDKYDDDEDSLITMKYSKFFMRNPLIQYAIYKKVHASSSG